MTWIGGGLRSEIIPKKQWLPKLNRHQTDRAAKDTKSTTKWGCLRTMGMHEWCLDAGMCRHIEWSHPQLTLSWVALQRNNTPQFDADLGPCLASLPVFSAQPPPHPTPHRVVAWKQMSVLVDLLGGGGVPKLQVGTMLCLTHLFAGRILQNQLDWSVNRKEIYFQIICGKTANLLFTRQLHLNHCLIVENKTSQLTKQLNSTTVIQISNSLGGGEIHDFMGKEQKLKLVV